MLNTDENERLTRVGPGTPCGELMRRYWQPAALAEELPPGGAPVPIRLLGEDLVLFRDDAGRPGLIGLHCSHRGADLSYGRLDDGGLRCIYHGWLYDVEGRCLEQPGEPTGSTFHEKIRHRAYPCRDLGGLILTYMGPGKPPLVPAFEFLAAPETHRFAMKFFVDCNYLQGCESGLDPVSAGILHRGAGGDPRHVAPAPSIEVDEIDVGLRQFTIFRFSAEKYYFKLNNFVLPGFSMVGAHTDGDGYQANWHVPIDDAHAWEYNCRFRRSGPIEDKAELRDKFDYITPDYHLTRGAENRYLQDREEMKRGSFAGMGQEHRTRAAFGAQSQGPIRDRTQENLGYTDVSIIAARRVLLRAIQDVEEGRDPPGVVRDPEKNDFSHVVLGRNEVPAGADWREHWKSVLFPAAVAEGRSFLAQHQRVLGGASR